MTDEYINLVLEDYKRKKEQNLLSYNLMGLTPAKINKECLIVFDKRFDKRDERLLKSFFNEREEYTELRQPVKQCDPDRFRALIKFLKGQSKTTDEKNIELLAWLIDFEGRPYKPDYEKMYQTSDSGVREKDLLKKEEVSYQAGKKTVPIQSLLHVPTEDKPENDSDGILDEKETKSQEKIITQQPETVNQNPQTHPLLVKKAVYMSLVVATVIGLTLFINKGNKKGNQLQPLALVTASTDQCMFWAGDHYQPVSCTKHSKDLKVSAFDAKKAAHLKKITQPDTITLNSINQIWYVKVNGNMEYYTAAGFHPVYTDLRLKPLTQYIYHKYLLR